MAYTYFDSEAFCGYTQITTFWDDFSIADAFGIAAIKDTYKRALDWKCDVKYFTELVMVLNWKCWYWVNKNNAYCELYSDLFYKARNIALKTFKGDDLKYFLRTTD